MPKLKTKSGAKKRFKMTATGKLKAGVAGKRHRLISHSAKYIRQQRGIEPLLLLDDVFSELDPVRSDQLLKLLPASQTLVTTASPLSRAMSPAVVLDISKRS